MNIQAQLDQEAFDLLPNTMRYINLDPIPTWAANMRGMLIQQICNARPCLDERTPEQLKEFDNDMLNFFYRINGDERFDIDRYERELRAEKNCSIALNNNRLKSEELD